VWAWLEWRGGWRATLGAIIGLDEPEEYHILEQDLGQPLAADRDGIRSAHARSSELKMPADTSGRPFPDETGVHFTAGGRLLLASS